MKSLHIDPRITHRESRAIETYLSDIGKIPLLTQREEIDLARRVRQEGDPIALHKLTRGNLRFVVSVAKQYERHNIPLIDLISEGNIGLVKAAQKFDETKGFKFITYAVWWIRQAIIQFIEEYGRQIRIPQNQIGADREIKKVAQQLVQELEREPSPDELASVLNMTPDEIETIQQQTYHYESLETPSFHKDGPASLIETIDNGDYSRIEEGDRQMNLRKDVKTLLGKLPEKQASILSRRYGIPLEKDEKLFRDEIDKENEGVLVESSMETVANSMDISRESVRQYEQRAFSKLERPLKKYTRRKRDV